MDRGTWARLIELAKEFIRRGEIFSRRKIQEVTGCTTAQARLMDWGLKHRDVIRHLPQKRQQLRDALPAFPMLRKFELRARQFQIVPDEREPFPLRQRLRTILPIQLLQRRLVVEQIKL